MFDITGIEALNEGKTPTVMAKETQSASTNTIRASELCSRTLGAGRAVRVKVGVLTAAARFRYNVVITPPR